MQWTGAKVSISDLNFCPPLIWSVRLAGGSHPADVVMVPVKYVVIKDVVKRGWLAHRPGSGPHGG
jgi:hypothetical protein